MRAGAWRRRGDGPGDSAGHARSAVPKVCGADIEVGNFIVGPAVRGDTAPLAARLLLRAIPGVASERGWSGAAAHASPRGIADLAPRSGSRNPQDVGRKFLPSTGGCAYIDLDHLELCVPEALSAYDHLAAWQATLRIARRALRAANDALPPGARIQVLLNNSDGHSNSYGSHCNFLITRRAWEDIFRRRIHYQLFLAAYQVSSIVFTGQGKVGAENDAPPVAFQLSQRADFFETLTGEQTTYRRPIINARDESLCAGAPELARLHCIFFDNTLCHGSTLLKIGVMQIVLAMIERRHVSPRLLLDDPVAAVRRWSRDPTLRARARLLSGTETTAVDLQRRFADHAQRFAAAGGCDGIVPRGEDILRLWVDTLDKLAARDFAALSGRLDWVLKRKLLTRALRKHPGLKWHSPAIKHLDLIYSSLDDAEGLYWTCERDGSVERLVEPAHIARRCDDPPEDTRAWTRAMLLRRAGADTVRVDWDAMTFEIPGAAGLAERRVLELADPLRFTRAEFERRCHSAHGLAQMLDALGAAESEAPADTRALARTTH